MSSPSSCRAVKLIDARAPGRPLVPARVYRDHPAAHLDIVEKAWAMGREEAAASGAAAGSAPLEHSHWDWRHKADSVEAGHHMLVTIECEGMVQGLKAVLRAPRPARTGDGALVYVDYLESAPWNLKAFVAKPHFAGVGTVLLADAVRLSLETGLGGRVGLHSLPQAEAFYTRCRMSRVGPDSEDFDLPYFEYTGKEATDWLATLGESP
jgi:hypothetical protein